MSRYVFKLPDLGEGTVDAEIVSWHIQPGETITEDEALVEVMTEKATVEVPAPVTGRVVSLNGAPGDRVPVGSELAVFETATAASPAPVPQAPRQEASVPDAPMPGIRAAPSAPVAGAQAERSDRVLTSPAIRRRAREAGLDLSEVAGSGPHGRILRGDLEARLGARPEPAAEPGAEPGARGTPLVDRSAPPGDTEEIKVIGLRRIIAERVSESARTIPHFSYVEEVDVTELEQLRVHLNAKHGAGAAPLTYLPFLILALARTLAEYPECNALYDAARGVIVRYRAAHVGVATQTSDGLKVPVVRDAGRKSLEELAQEIRRLSEAARDNTATRAELTGSTITVTSLGKLGGIASTPIINAPELAIVGVNRAMERPVVAGGTIVIRRMMNLSSSFDHRFIDGQVAAAMIQSLKERLEHPATIFL